MDLEGLRLLGLTPGGMKVYSAILFLGNATVNRIHEKTGMERRAIYDVINKLIEKGFISYTLERGKRTYQCSSPKRLSEEIQRKKEELSKFEKSISDIEKVYFSSKQRINSEIFRGKEGIKSVFEDMLNYKECYFIGGRWYVAKEMPLYWTHYNKRRIKNKIKWFNLVLKDAPTPPTKKLIYVKTLPSDFSGNPTIIWIYGDKIAHVMWGQDLFAFVIESKELAENYRKYHKYLWTKVAKV